MRKASTLCKPFWKIQELQMFLFSNNKDKFILQEFIHTKTKFSSIYRVFIFNQNKTKVKINRSIH